jgi:hypothetical protein
MQEQRNNVTILEVHSTELGSSSSLNSNDIGKHRDSTDRPIDGKDLMPLLYRAAAAKSPHEAFFSYSGRGFRRERGSRIRDIRAAHHVSGSFPAGMKEILALAEPGRRIAER